MLVITLDQRPLRPRPPLGHFADRLLRAQACPRRRDHRRLHLQLRNSSHGSPLRRAWYRSGNHDAPSSPTGPRPAPPAGPLRSPRTLSAILGDASLTAVVRRRPAKLIASLTHALSILDKHAKDLPEHKSWVAALTSARDALDALDKSVRASRVERRAMTPEVTRARLEWLKVYGAAKLIVEGVLKLHDKTSLLPEVFDDLAEVHRVSGVSDEAPPPAPGEAPSASPNA